MKLLVPTNTKQLSERALWFKKPIARKLAAKRGVEFGFELKGEPETIKEAPPLYWGYHLPIEFADEWYYHPEKRQELLSSLIHVAKLKANYVNFHGIKLWWKPDPKLYVRRYENRSTPEEYWKILGATIELAKKLKEIFPNLTLENSLPCDYYYQDTEILPETSYQTTAGCFNDLFYLKNKAGIEILLDTEHLILALNFLGRKKNYRHLPVKNFKLSAKEKVISDVYGYKIKKGFIPYVESGMNFEYFVEKIKAKKYHVTGSTQDVISGKKDLTHAPIEVDDKIFRQNLRLVLAQNPESILIETTDSSAGRAWNHLRPNEIELSFYNLCEILLEEL